MGSADGARSPLLSAPSWLEPGGGSTSMLGRRRSIRATMLEIESGEVVPTSRKHSLMSTFQPHHQHHSQSQPTLMHRRNSPRLSVVSVSHRRSITPQQIQEQQCRPKPPAFRLDLQSGGFSKHKFVCLFANLDFTV